MSLFDVPRGALIVHAVNAKGVWGSGIAKDFKERYPHAYNQYNSFCTHGYNKLGMAAISMRHHSEPHQVGWLVTSDNYGGEVDDVERILINTTLAVNDLCLTSDTDVIYSNKFNSGLFNVPWERTELVLKEVLRQHPNIDWIVCDNTLDKK